MKNTYNSIYKGLVVQDNDPLQAGRVKVFIPYLHAGLLPLDDSKYEQNINFGTLGKNVNEQNKKNIDLTDYLEIIKNKLPWCPVIMPITGETGNAKYNSETKLSSPSDSNSYASTLVAGNAELGGGPGDIYENETSIWANGAAAGGVQANPNAGAFGYSKKYNSAKGNFAIPSVNTQVWVMFSDGNPESPIVVGVAPSTLDWQQNTDQSTYPGGFSN